MENDTIGMHEKISHYRYFGHVLSKKKRCSYNFRTGYQKARIRILSVMFEGPTKSPFSYLFISLSLSSFLSITFPSRFSDHCSDHD